MTSKRRTIDRPGYKRTIEACDNCKHLTDLVYCNANNDQPKKKGLTAEEFVHQWQEWAFNNRTTPLALCSLHEYKTPTPTLTTERTPKQHDDKEIKIDTDITSA